MLEPGPAIRSNLCTPHAFDPARDRLSGFMGAPESITGNGGQFTICMTDPNLMPMQLGRPLKLHLVAGSS